MNDKSIMNDVIERISIICALKKIKKIDLIREGIAAQQTVYDVFNGKQKPGIGFLKKFITLFPDINGDWLLTGREDMYNKKKNKNLESDKMINQEYEIDIVYIKRIYSLELENSVLNKENNVLKDNLLQKDNKIIEAQDKIIKLQTIIKT
ncbi:hypothetical protein ES705_51173 [subsurface metagenome]